jgi:hypothetical protein
MESHNAGFSPFPHSLEIPLGFPHSHGLDDRICVFSCRLDLNHSHRKGLVTDVSGPQRNAYPGTLTVWAALNIPFRPKNRLGNAAPVAIPVSGSPCLIDDLNYGLLDYALP